MWPFARKVFVPRGLRVGTTSLTPPPDEVDPWPMRDLRGSSKQADEQTENYTHGAGGNTALLEFCLSPVPTSYASQVWVTNSLQLPPLLWVVGAEAIDWEYAAPRLYLAGKRKPFIAWDYLEQDWNYPNAGGWVRVIMLDETAARLLNLIASLEWEVVRMPNYYLGKWLDRDFSNLDIEDLKAGKE